DRVTLTLRRDGRDEDVRLAAAAFPVARADELAWQLLGLEAVADDEGLVVRRVRSGSPAARIGVQKGDRLLGLGGTPLRSVAELRRKMVEVRAARSILLSVGRGPSPAAGGTPSTIHAARRSGVMRSPGSAHRMSRWISFSSSRTLPGHG